MNKCETELTETFITQKFIRDISLFQKYKAFKLKAEIYLKQRYYGFRRT